MIVCKAHNIVSPLGDTSEQNYRACLCKQTVLAPYGTPQGEVCLSLFGKRECAAYTLFESICIQSIEEALANTDVDASLPSVVFVVSSTKGNIADIETADIALPLSAQRIAKHFGNPNAPIVVSNACISGVNAIITATRLLTAEKYKTAIVVGADTLCPFIVSGFSSFKAISPEACRPFDADRKGLNLGEAAATMVLTQADHGWAVESGSMHNDANHISGPSRTAEGAYRCLRDILSVVSRESIAFVSVHGTATLYNDEMEAKALYRAGLQEVPILSLKGYFGHTLGAAGVLESILSMQALEHGRLPACKGYEHCGTSVPLNITNTVRPIEGRTFIKMLSGFGGTNAAIAFTLC